MTTGDVWGRGYQDFEEFMKWARTLYKGVELGRFNLSNYKDSSAYRKWIYEKQSGALVPKKEGQLRPAEETGELAKIPELEEAALRDWYKETYPGYPEPKTFSKGDPYYQYWRWNVVEPQAAPSDKEAMGGEPVYKIPGVLMQYPDGSYAYSDGTLVDPTVAAKMLDEYNQADQAELQKYNEGIREWQEMNRQLQQERQSRLGTEAMSRLWSRELTEARGGTLSDEQKAKVFESARGQLLSGLDPIVDAFQYWTIANKDNKWARKIQEGRSEMSPADRAEKWELEVEKARTRFKKVNELHKAASNDPGRKLSQGEQQEWEQASLHLTNALQESVQADKVLAGEANYYDRNFASDAPTWERDPRTGEKVGDPHYGGIVGAGTSQSAKQRPWRTPETPPAPEWLASSWPEATQALDPSKYALGGTSALRAIKMKGLTPSAQGWSRMLPSEQAGFMSHARWSGGVPADIMGRMESMLPQPSRGARWTPYRR